MPTLPSTEVVDFLDDEDEEEDFGPDPEPSVDPNPAYLHDDIYTLVTDQLTWRSEDG